MLEFFNSVNVPKLQTPEWNLQSFVALLSSKYEKIVSSVNHEFGPNGMYILLLFALFITLIIIIYVKVVLDTFRSSPRDNVSQQEKTPAEMFYVRDRVPVETELPPIDERIGDVNENEKPRLTRKMPKQANNKKESLKEKDKELSESLLKKTANETNDLLKDKLRCFIIILCYFKLFLPFEVKIQKIKNNKIIVLIGRKIMNKKQIIFATIYHINNLLKV